MAALISFDLSDAAADVTSINHRFLMELGCARHPRYEGVKSPNGSANADCVGCRTLYAVRYARRHDPNFVMRSYL